MSPLISIIIPSFNQAQFIEDTIKSIINQTYKKYEILIIDGKSTDNTLKIVKKYANKCNNIYYISESDQGQTHAINKGLKKAKGDIIAWLNSDDIYENNAFEKVVAAFNKNPNKQWLTGYCRVVDINNNEIRKLITKYKNYFLKNYSRKALFKENFISQPATFWTRQAFDESGYLTLKDPLTFDYEYWLRMSKISEPVIVKEYLARFRWYDTTKSGSSFETQLNNELKWIKIHGLNPKSLTYKLHVLNSKKNIFAYKTMAFFRKYL